MSRSTRQCGFTLIEVLVATLVLAVGVMGVAAMQMVSFQTGQSAYARARAVYLAQDMFDRMRANPDGYSATAVYDAVDTDARSSIPSGPACAGSPVGCTPRQMARQDVREWARHFFNVSDVDDYRPTLPNGRGRITRAAGTNEFAVTVSWDERDLDAGAGLTRTPRTRSVTLRTTLN